MDGTMIVWTDYMKYRVRLRGFDLAAAEPIVRHSAERYLDTVTGRRVAAIRERRPRMITSGRLAT
jgi:hypothetical protein